MIISISHSGTENNSIPPKSENFNLEWFEYDDQGRIILQDRPSLFANNSQRMKSELSGDSHDEDCTTRGFSTLMKSTQSRELYSAARILLAIIEFLDTGLHYRL